MDKPTSALGLALIALSAAAVGYLAASAPAVSGAADVGPIPPGEARSLDPAPAEVELAAAEEGPVRLFVFDEEATFQRAIHLPAGQDRGSFELPSGEPVVLLVPEASRAVEIDVPSPSNINVTPVATREIPRTLVTGEGGTIDEEITLTIPHRPASLAVAIDGEAEGLRVDARTSEGPILRQTNETTETGEPGELRLDPGNLANGTYRVDLHADRLDGRVTLLTRTLAGAQQLDALQAPDEELARLGTPVARIQAEQAWRVPVPGNEALTLAIEQGAWADVRIYGPEHRVVEHLEVGEEGPTWRWGSNGSAEPGYEAVEVALSEGTHTVYVDEIQADVDRVVHALVPGHVEARPGHPAQVESRSVEVPYPSASGVAQQTVRYAGGLLGVSVADGEGVAVDRRITVEDPRGVVFDRRDEASLQGTNPLVEQIEHVESFGTGPLEVHVETQAATGSVELAIDHYIP